MPVTAIVYTVQRSHDWLHCIVCSQRWQTQHSTAVNLAICTLTYLAMHAIIISRDEPFRKIDLLCSISFDLQIPSLVSCCSRSRNRLEDFACPCPVITIYCNLSPAAEDILVPTAISGQHHLTLLMFCFNDTFVFQVLFKFSPNFPAWKIPTELLSWNLCLGCGVLGGLNVKVKLS